MVGSGTKLQVNGAAYGNGIYLSPNSSTSFNYSRMYKSGKQKNESASRFLDHGRSMTCIALCEVISHPTLKKSGAIWVSPESDHVCTRFFFVYEAGQCGEDVNTQHKNNLQAIQDAVNFRAWNGVQIKWGAGNTSLRRMQQNAFQGLKGIMLRGHPYTD